MKKIIKQIAIDQTSEESIRKAEKEKAKLENQGYHFVFTHQTGFNKFTSVYEKSPRRKKLGSMS